MRIATLNLGHQTLRPKQVPDDLLFALLELDCDVVVLTEFVATPAYLAALRTCWPHVAVSDKLQYSKSRAQNQVAILSGRPMTVLDELPNVPDACARTNHLSVRIGDVVVTGLRAPAYEKRSVWYEYWRMLGDELTGDIVIGDLNVDPKRTGKKDRVIPPGWALVTPEGGGPSFRSLKYNGESALDHALLGEGWSATRADYRSEFFGRWGLDHCPLLVEVSRV